LLWAPGVPKTVLIAGDARAATGITEPTPTFNAAWTVAIDEAFSRVHYCTWGFRTGVRTFRSELEAATRVISAAIKERGLRACFEFDHEANWFGGSTLFAVTDMVNLAVSLPKSSSVRDSAEKVAYAVRYDTVVERESGLNADQRSAVCLALGDLDFGRLEEARVILESLDEDSKNIPFVQDLRARTAWLSGDRDGAIELWRTALDNHPSWQLRDRIIRYLRVTEDLE
jgi:hypothetical protein